MCPVRIRGFLLSTFKLAITIETSHIHWRIGSLLFQSNGSRMSTRTLQPPSLLSRQRVSAVKWVTSLFRALTSSGSLLTAFPRSLGWVHVHFLIVLKTEKTCTQCSMKSFNDSLIAMNVHDSSPVPHVVLRRLLYFNHKFTPGATEGHLNGPLSSSTEKHLKLPKTPYK